MKYFTIKELCETSKPFPNIPNEEQEANLEYLVDNILDKAREILGSPIKVSSGFRSPQVNKAVGGSNKSEHLTGQAADLTCYDNKKLFNILRKMGGFSQLINEYNYSWIHVSIKRDGNNRNQILKAVTIDGKTKYINE